MKNRMRHRRCIMLFVLVLLVSVTACGLQSEEKLTVTSTPEEKIVSGQTEEGEDVSGGETQICDGRISEDAIGDWKSAYEKFFASSTKRVLAENSGENPQEAACLYSPVNFYLCLAMLSEMTANDTHDQIYASMGTADQTCTGETTGCLESEEKGEKVRQSHLRMLRQWSQKLYKRVESKQCSLGNSVWLNAQIPFEERVIQDVEEYYHGKSTDGQMGSEGFDRQIQAWLNKQTKGKLQDAVSGVHTSSQDALLLFSAIYFEDQWQIPFDKSKTKKETFYGAAFNTCGTITEAEKTDAVTCDFLHGNMYLSTITAKQYQEASIPMEHNTLHIILPQEGYGVSDLLDADKGVDLVKICDSEAKDRVYTEVEFSMPKLDFESALNLKPIMKDMGIKEVFQVGKADFSPLTAEENLIYLSKATQNSRLQWDENGCSVASYTEMEAKAGAALPDEIIEMHCDRPFLFILTDEGDLPLFAGVVNRVGE